ncbi:MAG: glycosyltransferase [Phycisphaerales bacterium]
MLDRDALLRAGFYFYVHNEAWQPGRQHYAAACVVSGLRRLGAEVFSNVGGPGFSGVKPLTPEAGHTVVFLATEPHYSPQYAQAIAAFPGGAGGGAAGGGRKLILTMADIGHWYLAPPDVTILVCHTSRFITLPGRRLPWAFGLSDERIAAAEAARASQPPRSRSGLVEDSGSGRPTLLCNFRPSGAQGVRNALELVLIPHLERHFEIDRRIGADPADHFARLAAAAGCLAYGGDFAANLARNPELAWNPGVASTHGAARWSRESAVVRWDSWRFWESLAAGCLTLHLDLDRYGCHLPEMPRPWEHYIPIDLADPGGTVERLMAERPRWPAIAEAGRAWAVEQYSPGAVTERFLRIVTELQ